ncbi:DNA polymerase alpha/epsilon subunit B-domain-containing protein [Lipomyces orientalis]|uniref:DNA polymerase alpha/epsilon subunit B-domain-containing protein n=1 Tax=Lipomyces orientalis TaxID=1233043 RepID=A0ACC3TKH1_9ASCO
MPSQNLQSFEFTSASSTNTVSSFNSFKKPPNSTARPLRSPSPAPLPIELQPSLVRPLAYRILSKKHGLNLKSSGLDLLATYIGRKFGRDWRTRSEPFLDQIGRRWKEQDRGLFIDAQLLQVVIREVELRSASFTGSTTASPIEVVDDPLEDFCPQEFFHVWNAFSQPRWTYNRVRKHFERASQPTLFPSAKHQVHAFSSRYYLLQQRLLRNEEFQPPSFHASNAASWHAITMIKNLLGRHGKSFLILGLLVRGSNGNWWAEDPSGRLELDLDNAVAGNGYFVPGCILLFDGVYTRSEMFQVKSLHHPPAESRSASREAYGYLDFMGIGGIGSTPDGRFDLAIERKMIAEEQRKSTTKVVALGGNLYLDELRTLDALGKVFDVLEHMPPLTVILFGSFMSLPLYNSGTSSLYKENFDQLAQLLSKYPDLCASTTFIFVPGDNDPWGSTASAGGPMLWPQRSVPEIFTSQVRRVLKKVIWSSNPSRLCYFSQEIVICRDDLAARLRRNNVLLNSSSSAASDKTDISPDEDTQVDDICLDSDSQHQVYEEEVETEKMIRTIFDQGHISPWPSSLRPVISEYEHVLSLTPLPTAMIICDPTASRYAHSYKGCHAMNPSRFLSFDERRVSWIEYSTDTRTSTTNSTPI